MDHRKIEVKPMFNRILVPLDGSQLAETVMPLACSLANQLLATLVLFHVVEKKAPQQVHGESHLQTAEEARSYLQAMAENLSCKGTQAVIDVHEVQESGVAQTIRDHAEELNTNLIIMCTHGSGGLRDLFLGSIAQQVVRQGNTPLLFINPEHIRQSEHDTFRRILLPLDGSPTHETSIPVATYLANQLKAEVHLLSVIPTSDSVPVKQALSRRISPRAANFTLESSVKNAEAYLQKIGESIADEDGQVFGAVMRGNAPDKLMDYIEEEEIDLVILATHGHNAIDARWEGSLTPQFLPRSTIPVLLVQGEEE
jgi:nucleotide-binding universal stress UspA family protein